MANAAPLALSLGDPAGIGPEVVAEAWAQREPEGLSPFFIVGGAGVVAAAARSRGIDLPIARIGDPTEARETFATRLPVLGDEDCQPAFGVPDRTGAELALHSLGKAASLALSGEAGAIVTAPIAKSKLAEVGFMQPGQTEFLDGGPYAIGTQGLDDFDGADVTGKLDHLGQRKRSEAVGGIRLSDDRRADPHLAVTAIHR